MATVLFRPYGIFAKSSNNKEVDLDSDSLKIALLTSSYTPNLDTHDYYNDLTNELTTALGYTAGGQVLASVTNNYIAAASATAAAISTAYAVGDTRRPASSNGFVYKCVVAGTSSGTAPTWPTTIGLTVADNTVTWANMGHGYQAFDFTDPSWATATFAGVRYAVIYDDTPGTTATKGLIALGDFGSDQAGGGGAFAIQVAPEGALLGYAQ